MSDPAFHQQNRARLAERLAERRAAGLFFTAAHKVRNHDSEYRFRPESDFWWLTGFSEPESALLVLPPLEGTGRARSILYLRDKDREREIWTGKRLGVAAAPAALRVDEARPIERLWDDLPTLLKNYQHIVTRTGLEPERDRHVLETLTKLRWAARGMIVPPLELCDVAPFTHELRLFKTPPELERMRKAAALARAGHVAAMRAARPGLHEYELEALLEHEFRKAGSTGPAYASIVAGGANACILHYVENSELLRDGQLLLIDAGAEWEYYASDVTRTFPVNGRFSPEQRALYELVLEAQQAAIAHVRPGVSFVSVHERALRVLVEGFVRLGLLAGKPEELIAAEAYRRFYMHRTSHWLGLDVHDCGAYVVDGASRTLEPGMVLTVEPGCYVAEDDDSVPARWRGIGIRIEDDLLLTPAGNEVLTAAIPKSVAEVEAACQGRALAGVS
jgi:Xaa-Pro aminopeptidase